MAVATALRGDVGTTPLTSNESPYSGTAHGCLEIQAAGPRGPSGKAWWSSASGRLKSQRGVLSLSFTSNEGHRHSMAPILLRHDCLSFVSGMSSPLLWISSALALRVARRAYVMRKVSHCEASDNLFLNHSNHFFIYQYDGNTD
jgi:hypothetical protein